MVKACPFKGKEWNDLKKNQNVEYNRLHSKLKTRRFVFNNKFETLNDVIERKIYQLFVLNNYELPSPDKIKELEASLMESPLIKARKAYRDKNDIFKLRDRAKMILTSFYNRIETAKSNKMSNKYTGKSLNEDSSIQDVHEVLKGRDDNGKDVGGLNVIFSSIYNDIKRQAQDYRAKSEAKDDEVRAFIDNLKINDTNKEKLREYIFELGISN